MYLRDKTEYWYIAWSPTKQAEINRLEKIQKHCASKTEGMEHMEYYERRT